VEYHGLAPLLNEGPRPEEGQGGAKSMSILGQPHPPFYILVNIESPPSSIESPSSKPI
jgi:hypothetical protein